MKIVVNTRLLLKGKLSGIGWFTYHTLKRIVQSNPQHQFIFLFDRKYDKEFIFGSNVIPEVVFPPTRHPILQWIWFELSIKRIIKKHKPDLFYSPDGYSSLSLKNIPKLVVLHDINFYHHRSNLSYSDRFFVPYFFQKYAQDANHLLTVSEFSKNDIAKAFNINTDKIEVVYNASDEIYKPISESTKVLVKNRFTEGFNYFLYIGVLIPRKNISRMLKAYDRFRKNSQSNTKLVIVGHKLFLSTEMERTYEDCEFKKDIIFTGHLPSEELKDILGAALSLVFVSYFEGFGIPIIEAMNADVPVITSNTSSMPEIAGNAALLVNPYSIEEIAVAMKKMNDDESLRNVMIENGRIQRKKFNWDKSADKIWQAMERLMQDNNVKSV